MDLAFLLARTEFVVALDVAAFPVAEDWLETLLGPLRNGKYVSGAQALRGYIHPCCLAMRTEYFARRRHTFTPHVGTWNPEHLGRDEWDTGESITRARGPRARPAVPTHPSPRPAAARHGVRRLRVPQRRVDPAPLRRRDRRAHDLRRGERVVRGDRRIPRRRSDPPLVRRNERMTETEPSAVPASRPIAAVIADLDRDPPPVHAGAPTGVWAAAHDCLEFIGTRVRPGTRTLETGCGASTIVFAAAGAHHTAVFLNDSEGRAVTTWCGDHGIDLATVTLRAGSSSQVLPTLDPGPLDLVMVDGCHGFPFPQLDWYYAAAHLVDGGILIVDDTQLAAPYELRRYLRTTRAGSDSTWARSGWRSSGSATARSTRSGPSSPSTARPRCGSRRHAARPAGTLGRLRKKRRG